MVGALCPGSGLQRPGPCKSSHALISHLTLPVNFVPRSFHCWCGGRWCFLKGSAGLAGGFDLPRHGGVSAEGNTAGHGGIQHPPKSHRETSSKRHLWAILASTAIVITISNYAELYAFGAYYRHQQGVLLLFPTCSLA